jgi:hypothetical protein
MITKKERAEIDGELTRLRVRAALCWSDDVQPDVPIPKGGDSLSEGWLPAYRGAEVACSSAVCHALGRTDKTTTQGPRELYSSKVLALRARRYEFALEAAQALARIDALILEASLP